ncbi:MAG TPA: amidase [Stellaceae bacterium]|jgi:aspartyl-tRNA(Asn)/glutamyl-tRNA(Gln) amidotransferase subunit A|nr:amidase [Stellaceae bacterium]
MAGDDTIAYASAVSLTELYRKRSLSPVEATRLLFERLDALQAKLNAFCVVDRDGALAAAHASEERWRRGEPIGPLDGVPATIKDLMLTRGFPTLRGSHLVDRDQDWPEDTPAVARLREAGTVILGKTTTPEFGWKALGDSPLTGITRNPWDLSRTSGGSSAGAAAAAAAGIGVLHLGSDGAGSIRTPSCFCGICGLKPSFGRVPAYPPSPLGLLSHHGPIARTVADAAMMLTAIARPDHRDPYALPADDRDWHAGIDGGVEGWRIAFSPGLGYARVDPEVASAVADAARQFEGLGAVVEQVDRIFASPRDALFTLWAAGVAALLQAYPDERKGLVDPGLSETAAAGEQISAAEWVRADLVRNALGRTMAAFHQRYDLLLTPTMPIPALPAGQDLNDPAHERHWIDWSPFSYPFNMTRQPAASIPCGMTSAGLPIGLQIVGPLYADARVLRAARAFETTQPERRPPVPT